MGSCSPRLTRCSVEVGRTEGVHTGGIPHKENPLCSRDHGHTIWAFSIQAIETRWLQSRMNLGSDQRAMNDIIQLGHCAGRSVRPWLDLQLRPWRADGLPLCHSECRCEVGQLEDLITYGNPNDVIGHAKSNRGDWWSI